MEGNDMRFFLHCDDEVSNESFSDLTLSQTIDEITNHLAMGYEIEARQM
ncbi:unnamed protein product, partial [marine sediment metagenome]